MSTPLSTLFPVYNQPWTCPVAFFNASNALVTGWNGNVTAATIIPDNLTPASVTNPNTVIFENSGTGLGYFELTALQMQCRLLQVVITLSSVSNPGANAFVANIFPAYMVEIGGWDEAYPLDPIQALLNIAAVDRNYTSQSAGSTAPQIVYKTDSSTPYMQGLVQVDPVTGVIRTKLA